MCVSEQTNKKDDKKVTILFLESASWIGMSKTMRKLAFGYLASLLKEANAMSEGLAMNRHLAAIMMSIQSPDK